MKTQATEQPPALSRMEKRRRSTRAKLLFAAHEVMAEAGVDAAKIKDITDRADVGFGTFYNYFETKDDLAGQVLDCVINDLGRRNVLATAPFGGADQALVVPISTRLVIREAARTPMFQWWAARPDLLSDRMRDGFGPFARRDLRHAIDTGLSILRVGDVDLAWALATWTMVGAIHDIVIGERPLEAESVVVAAIMRMLGFDPGTAERAATTELPQYSAPMIDWSFSLADDRTADN